jgi:hypothetical protein
LIQYLTVISFFPLHYSRQSGGELPVNRASFYSPSAADYQEGLHGSNNPVFMLNSIASFHGKLGYRYCPIPHDCGVVAESGPGLDDKDTFSKRCHAFEYNSCAFLSLVDWE